MIWVLHSMIEMIVDVLFVKLYAHIEILIGWILVIFFINININEEDPIEIAHLNMIGQKMIIWKEVHFFFIEKEKVGLNLHKST